MPEAGRLSLQSEPVLRGAGHSFAVIAGLAGSGKLLAEVAEEVFATAFGHLRVSSQ